MRAKTRRDTAQSCYAELRTLLMHGQIPSQTRIGEVEWSQRLGVHRVALREAIALLAHEGLLVRGERGGFFVPTFERRDIAEIVEARLVIELGALRLTVKRSLEPADLVRIERLLDSMRPMVDAHLVLGFAEADRQFHEELVRLSGNSRLVTLFRHSPIPHLPPMWLLGVSRATLERSLDEHCRLVELIVHQNGAEAATLLESHISRLIERV